MARYRIKQTNEALEIRVTETGPDSQRLLAAFQECQEGRCDCPTEEYEKVSALSVDRDGDEAITLRLTPRPGERFDEAEIEVCLQHTISRTPD